MGWWRNERALECAEYLEQPHIVSPCLQESEHTLTWDGGEISAHLSVLSTLFSLRPSPMCFAPSGPMLLARRLRGPNKEQPQIVSPADNIAEHLLTWDCVEASAHSSVGHADVLGAFRADAVAAKTARAKQGATTHCEPLLTTKRTHLAAVARTSERALERDCEGQTRSNYKLSAVSTARAKEGGIKNCQPPADNNK
eukprot:scaffold3542_cov113-Isochrysis_galbana.AAC.3